MVRSILVHPDFYTMDYYELIKRDDIEINLVMLKHPHLNIDGKIQ